MRTLFQALGAVFPLGTGAGGTRPRLGGRERAAAAPAATETAARPAASGAARRVEQARPAPATTARDPYYLCVVPYLPSETPPPALRHPRVPNPFRRFPNRAQALFALMERAVPNDDGAAASDGQY